MDFLGPILIQIFFSLPMVDTPIQIFVSRYLEPIQYRCMCRCMCSLCVCIGVCVVCVYV